MIPKDFTGRYYDKPQKRIGEDARMIWVKREPSRGYYYSRLEWVPLEGRRTLKGAVEDVKRMSVMNAYKHEGFMIFSRAGELLYGNDAQAEDFSIVDVMRGMRVIYELVDSPLGGKALAPAKSVEIMYPCGEIAPLMNLWLKMGKGNYIEPIYDDTEKVEDLVNKQLVEYCPDVAVEDAIKHFGQHFVPARRMLAFKIYRGDRGRKWLFYTSDADIAPLY